MTLKTPKDCKHIGDKMLENSDEVHKFLEKYNLLKLT